MKPQHYKSQSIETFYNMVEPPAAPTSIPNTHHHLTSSAPVVSATFPSISSPLPYSNRVANQKAPDIIYLSKNKKDQQQDLGDFLTALSKMDDVVGARTGSFKIKH
jgi:hypothetical protein